MYCTDISQNAYYSGEYAIYALKGRVDLCEEILSSVMQVCDTHFVYLKKDSYRVRKVLSTQNLR